MIKFIRWIISFFRGHKSIEANSLPTNPPINFDIHKLTGENYVGEAYCVKCKEKRECKGPVTSSESGRRLGWGTCPVCGITMNRILGDS